MNHHLWVIVLVLYPKKRRGDRIGERKYATICNELPFFANGVLVQIFLPDIEKIGIESENGRN